MRHAAQRTPKRTRLSVRLVANHKDGWRVKRLVEVLRHGVQLGVGGVELLFPSREEALRASAVGALRRDARVCAVAAGGCPRCVCVPAEARGAGRCVLVALRLREAGRACRASARRAGRQREAVAARGVGARPGPVRARRARPAAPSNPGNADAHLRRIQRTRRAVVQRRAARAARAAGRARRGGGAGQPTLCGLLRRHSAACSSPANAARRREGKPPRVDGLGARASCLFDLQCVSVHVFCVSVLSKICWGILDSMSLLFCTWW